MRRKVAGVLCALGTVVFAGAAVGAGPAGAATDEERIPAIGPATVPADACAASFPAGAFDTAKPEGSVAPGQAMAVDIRWRTAWHPGDAVDVLGCVAANGHFVGGTVERGVTNNGLWVHKFAVPANAANAAVVCEASLVIGPGASGAPEAERSDPDCFTVTAAAAQAEPAPAAANPGPAATEGKATTPTSAAGAPAPPTRSASAVPTPPAAAAAPASAPSTASVVAAPKPGAAPTTQLPHTGARDRMLLLLAGVLLIVGGWALTLRPIPRALPIGR
jgi:LPXTG-motif cell wall-anchored protein